MELANIDQTEAAPALARFTIEPAALGDAVAYLAKRIIERRNTIPIVSSIAFRADLSGHVTLTGTDFDIDASVTLPAAVESPGEFCTDAAALSDVLAKVRKDKGRDAVAFQDGERLEVKSGRNVFKLRRAPVDDFPAIVIDADPLPVTFDAPAARFLADLGALSPCISKEENRYYLCGIAMQVRNLGGRDRFAMIATDGHKIGVASRELPQGADLMPDCLLPSKVVAALRHAEKLAPTCDALAVEFDPARGGGLFRFTLGAVTITAKAIDGTFPDWERLFDEGNLAPTGEALPMFPELLPAAPLHSMQAIEKAVKGAIVWEPASDGMIGTLPDDTGLMFGAVSNPNAANQPVKGYHVTYDAGQSAAFSYLAAIADQRAGHTVSRDKCRLQVRGVEILGLTVGDYKHIPGAYVDRPNWETLHIEKVWQEGVNEYETGAHSILMPRDRTKMAPDASLMIDGDSTLYPLGINSGNAVHLSKDHVRAIVGESAFETMALTIAGRVIYILRWLFEQGDSRFLTVRADGRCFTGKDAGKAIYLSRGQVEAALRGEVEPDAAPMPEIASPAPAQDESAPIAAQESGEAVNALHGQEIAPDELSTVTQELPAPAAPDLEAITARLDALEAALATLSAESTVLIPAPSNESAEIITPPTARAKRTAAHERAIRRAWQERKARRGAQGGMAIYARRIDALETELRLAKDEQVLDKQAFAETYARAEQFARRGNQHRERRLRTTRRARRMIAAVRARIKSAEERYDRAYSWGDDLRGKLHNAECRATSFASAIKSRDAELARLKRDMADPMQPERASDISRLVGERDTARTALAAMAARAERAEQTVNAMADRFEGLVSRVTRAEAALRQAKAA